MPLVDRITYIHEPTDLQCGQAVLAMLSGLSVDEIIKLVGTEKETKLIDMKNALNSLKISFKNERISFADAKELPRVAILSLETPRCWHWSLVFEGVFYDPEHGVLNELPECNRRYYWEIIE